MPKTDKPRRNISLSSPVHRRIKKYADDNGMKIQAAVEKAILVFLPPTAKKVEEK